MERHLGRLRACRRCPEVLGPPVVGQATRGRVLLVGQAPGPREREVGRPFVWSAGRTLFKWFASIGVSEELFRSRAYMAAVIRCFPGKIPQKSGDRRPSGEEIQHCRPFFETELALLEPELVVPVGRMAIDLFAPGRRLDEVVGEAFAASLHGHRFTCAPLPHPSGLSRWIQTEAGKAAIGRALARIAAHPAWQATFAQSGR